ncbi:MAG: hypothetical protein ACLUAR_16790 [Pilosibacter sp.]
MIPSLVLMERAALAVAESEEILERTGRDSLVRLRFGNNGADGVAAAEDAAP